MTGSDDAAWEVAVKVMRPSHGAVLRGLFVVRKSCGESQMLGKWS